MSEGPTDHLFRPSDGITLCTSAWTFSISRINMEKLLLSFAWESNWLLGLSDSEPHSSRKLVSEALTIVSPCSPCHAWLGTQPQLGQPLGQEHRNTQSLLSSNQIGAVTTATSLPRCTDLLLSRGSALPCRGPATLPPHPTAPSLSSPALGSQENLYKINLQENK